MAWILAPVTALEKNIGIELYLAEVGLEQRPPLYFPAFGAIPWPFDFQQKTDVDRIFSGFGELELVFPFDCIVLG